MNKRHPPEISSGCLPRGARPIGCQDGLEGRHHGRPRRSLTACGEVSTAGHATFGWLVTGGSTRDTELPCKSLWKGPLSTHSCPVWLLTRRRLDDQTPLIDISGILPLSSHPDVATSLHQIRIKLRRLFNVMAIRSILLCIRTLFDAQQGAFKSMESDEVVMSYDLHSSLAPLSVA